MTAAELAERMTHREFVQWDEFYALEAEREVSGGRVGEVGGDRAQAPR